MYRPQQKPPLPLYDIRQIIRVLKITTGFPLQPQTCLFQEFAFKTWIEYFKFAIRYALALSACFYMGFLCTQQSTEHTISECISNYREVLHKGLENRNLTWLDFTLFILLIFINVIFDVVFFWLFQGISKVVSRL